MHKLYIYAYIHLYINLYIYDISARDNNLLHELSKKLCFTLSWGISWRFFVFYDLLIVGIKKVVWIFAIAKLNKAAKLFVSPPKLKKFKAEFLEEFFSRSSPDGTCDW